MVNSILEVMANCGIENPRLKSLMKDVRATKEIVDPIDKVFNAKGAIKDEASEQLGLIRLDMLSFKRSINMKFSKALEGLLEKGGGLLIQEGFINDEGFLP